MSAPIHVPHRGPELPKTLLGGVHDLDPDMLPEDNRDPFRSEPIFIGLGTLALAREDKMVLEAEQQAGLKEAEALSETVGDTTATNVLSLPTPQSILRNNPDAPVTTHYVGVSTPLRPVADA